jgi:hypothetical protein
MLSHVPARSLLFGRKAGDTAATISLDLGLTESSVRLEAERVTFPGGQWLAWKEILEIAGSPLACFVVGHGDAEKVQHFSEAFNRFYSLMPTAGAPTLLVSGIAMHRIQGIEPHQDTLRKLRPLAPITGRVLDTCTGLGYTAVEAARTAEWVVTIELDPAVLDVARQNPWSRQLFESRRIEQVIGDAYEKVQDLADGSFARIIHDPPMFSLAGELYSGEFYRQLVRLLSAGGRLFHYIGDLDSRSGRNVVRGVMRRLDEAGFRRVVRRPEAFGVVAYR